MNERSRWWVLAAVSLGTFMTYLDTSVVNVSLPTIAQDLRLSIAGLEWIVSGYILVFAGLMLVGGRLADVYGRRLVFIAGLVVFTGASLVAGLAGSQAWLLAGRMLQGGGAALLTPAGLALLPAVFTRPKERAAAVAIWSAAGAMALAFGPLTGGIVSEHWHWGWIFGINVPIGAVTIVIAAASIRERPGSRRARRLDAPGLVTSAAALLSLTWALIEGERRGWTSGLILGAFGLAALGAVAFLLVQRQVRDPMMDLSLFRSRAFSGGTLAIGVWAFGVFGVYFFTSLYLQGVLAFSPVRTGLAFVPMALVLAVVAGAAAPLAHRVGIHVTVAAGLAWMAAAVFGLSLVGAGAGMGDVVPWLVLYGVGGGLIVPLTDVILGQFPAEREGVASGVLNATRQVFGLLGVTVLGAIVNTRRADHLRTGADPSTAFLSGYQLALVVATAVIACGVPISLYALRTRRAAHHPRPAGHRLAPAPAFPRQAAPGRWMPPPAPHPTRPVPPRPMQPQPQWTGHPQQPVRPPWPPQPQPQWTPQPHPVQPQWTPQPHPVQPQWTPQPHPVQPQWTAQPQWTHQPQPQWPAQPHRTPQGQWQPQPPR